MSVQEMVNRRETVDEEGTRRWLKDRLLHRDGDRPAVVFHDGSKFWYRDGKLHRDGDLPAVKYADGMKFWYRHGVAHRDGDLPAAIWNDGSMSWRKDGGAGRREHGLPVEVKCDGSVVYEGTFLEGHTSEKVVSVRYEGIEYSAPHWLLDGHETSREKSEV